jgi:hypothetical protein
MPEHTNETTDATTQQVSAVAIPWTTASAKQRTKELRLEAETAGVIVNGVPISTERGDHRNTMLSLALAGSQNPAMQVPFKLADGSFTVMSGAFAAAAWQFGQSYVAQCFGVEAQASAAIDAAQSDAEIDAILDGLQWPSRTHSTEPQ